MDSTGLREIYGGGVTESLAILSIPSVLLIAIAVVEVRIIAELI